MEVRVAVARIAAVAVFVLIDLHRHGDQPAVAHAALGDDVIGEMLHIGGLWHLQFDVFNLFNSHAHQIDYFYASQLANESAPVFDTHFKPVEPLSARLTLAASF
jgi:hypothetical protein